jgi:hypothetical protein
VSAPTKHPIHGSIDAAACRQGENVVRLIRVLDRVRPDRIRAVRLMEILGIPYSFRYGSIEPYTAYISFACAAARAGEVLRKHGWQLCRTGGSCRDEYWIEKQEPDPRLN